jgi:cobalt/nickel transport system ATP-binding protein
VTDPEPTSSALDVSGLSFAYPDGHQALQQVTFAVEAGERLAVLGPNGAGKTTLALHLNGIHVPSSGQVVVGGLEVCDQNLREVRRRVGIVFQDPDDQLFMPTVRDDVAFGPANLGWRDAELDSRVAEALAAVHMEGNEDRRPHHLSLGQRRRVAVATVVAMHPEILVFDEPTANLDPAARRELVEVVRSTAVTTVIATHDLPLALELCPRSLLLDQGRVVADRPTGELLADEELLAAHRLELPFGFDPRATRVW